MATSTHVVEVVPITLEPHPNADSLSIVKVWGFTCCVNTAQWAGIDKAAYIPPDSIVPDTEDYAFLRGHRRIRVKKLRGIVSMGLLMPAPERAEIGEDVAERMGIEHYEPEMHFAGLKMQSECASPPSGFHPKYEVDNLRRYPGLFEDDEPVHISEKIHGASARYVFQGSGESGEMHVGSHTQWKKYDPDNLWWKALAAHPEVREWCEKNPGITVYAEVYGQVQKGFQYGVPQGEARIAVFDLLDGNIWMDVEQARDLSQQLPWVPTVATIPYTYQWVCDLAEGMSLISGANHIREGIVVRPMKERVHPRMGRVCLKLVSNAYLEMK